MKKIYRELSLNPKRLINGQGLKNSTDRKNLKICNLKVLKKRNRSMHTVKKEKSEYMLSIEINKEKIRSLICCCQK